jgi:predicted dehydrogenase
VARARGSNDRIRIASVGVGGRGTSLLRDIIGLSQRHNCEIAAVCDVWKVNLNRAAATAKKAFGSEPMTSTRFGDILSMDDIDAIVIATPDFAHTPIMIEALKAGKDVYVEKPMAMDLDNANEALDLARAQKRVVQVGTQRRSEGRFRTAREVVASGVLGPISRVDAANNFNHARWLRPYDDCKEREVDWDAYLFNRPKVPFDARFLRQWHLFKMCTNGLSGLWMCHLIDAACMVMGSTYPRSVVAHGGTYVWKENRQHTDTFHALADYPEDYLFSWGMGLGNATGTYYKVCGVNGTLDLQNHPATLSGQGGKGAQVIKKTTELEDAANESHMGNWLNCLRSRQRPNADIAFGHQHSAATIMAARALETGRRQKYDAENRRIYAG